MANRNKFRTSEALAELHREQEEARQFSEEEQDAWELYMEQFDSWPDDQPVYEDADIGEWPTAEEIAFFQGDGHG